MVAKRIYTDNGRVGVFVFNIGGNSAHTDTHSTNKHKGIKVLPMSSYCCTLDEFGSQFLLDEIGNMSAFLANLYDGYLDLWSR